MTPDALNRSVTTAAGRTLLVEARPSGVVRWNYEMAGPEGLLVFPAALLWSLSGRLLFRWGWTVWVSDADGKVLSRHRHPSDSAAVASLDPLTASLAGNGHGVPQIRGDRPS